MDAAQRCPKDFSVQIDGGTVCVGGLTLALPISGPGYLRVLYTSPAIRILASLTRRASLVEPATSGDVPYPRSVHLGRPTGGRTPGSLPCSCRRRGWRRTGWPRVFNAGF